MDSQRARYINCFGLRENPFSATSNPRSIYTNDTFQQAFASILGGIRACKGIMVLTGAVGTGKTCLARKVSTELGASTHCVFLQNSHLDIAQEIKDHETSLNETAQKGKPVVLFIDDAQNLPEESLAKLLLLSRPEDSDKTSVQIVLVGMPELKETLNKPGLRQFTQCIAAQCELEPLNSDEIGAFISQQLHAVGCERDDLYSLEAIQQIALHSRGVPRLINILCNSAIFIASMEASDIITAQIVDKAVQRSSLVFSTHAVPSPGPSVEIGNDMASNGRTMEDLPGAMDEVPVHDAKVVQTKTGGLAKKSGVRDEPGSSAGLVIDPESTATKPTTIVRASILESKSRGQGVDVTTVGQAGKRWYISAGALALFMMAGSAGYIYRHGSETEGLLTPHSPVLAYEATPLMSAPPVVERVSSMQSSRVEDRAAGPAAAVPVATNSSVSLAAAETHLAPVMAAEPAQDPAPSTSATYWDTAGGERSNHLGTATTAHSDRRNEETGGQTMTYVPATETPVLDNAALRQSLAGQPVQLASVQHDLSPARHETGAKAGKESLSKEQARDRLAQMGLPLSGQALVNSVQKRDTQVTELLLAAGVSPDERDSLSGHTAITYAAWNGDVAIVRRLLDQGAAVNVRNSDGWTALTDAAINGHTAVVQTLLEAEADPNAQDNDGKTALMAAVWNGHIETVRVLLDRGADVNSENNDNWTALLYAAWSGHIGISRLLVERGADLDATNNEGQAALAVAQSQGHSQLAQFIQTAEN